MCFGGGTQEVETKVELPKYIERGGEKIFGAGEQVSSRPYPFYPGARIADFAPDETAAFDVARENVGSWYPSFQAGLSQTASGTAPVGGRDIARYANPYQGYVEDELRRQTERQKIEENAAMSRRGSYLNEDRRAAIDALRDERLNETIGRLRSDAFQRALQQGNIERNRDLTSAGQFYGAAPMRQQLGLGDVGTLSEIGLQQRGLTQRGLDLGYSDFLRQFGYPQQQIDWINQVLRGIPAGQTTTQEVGKANTAAQILGLTSLALPIVGSAFTGGFGGGFGGGGYGAPGLGQTATSASGLLVGGV